MSSPIVQACSQVQAGCVAVCRLHPTSLPVRSVLPSRPWLQLFLESHLDAAQLAQLRELWRDYERRVYAARQRREDVVEQVGSVKI